MLTLVLRIELPSKNPALYFRQGQELTSYTRAEQHCTASLEFYRRRTRPLDPTDPRAVALLQHWASLPGGEAYRVRQRLPRT